MHPSLNVAIRAARAGSSVLMRYLNRLDNIKIEQKSATDFVSEVDRSAEQAIIQVISKSFPDHSIMAEESGLSSKSSDLEWIIDPLDGTTNYLRGIPQYSISIALREKQELIAAVVYDPLKDELFSASKGDGATMNNTRLRASKLGSMAGALIGTGIPFKENQDLAGYLKSLEVIAPGTAGIRRAGSAALDLAYVAAGRFDGFWEYGVQPWDIAAGILLIKESGGYVTDIDGSSDPLTTGNVLAGNPKVYTEMLARLDSLK